MPVKKERGGPIRSLVVDDSPTARELIVSLLQASLDIVVVGTGANGEEAIRLAARLKPDVIAMDVRMPRMDGFEATRRIMRECPTPIVLVSASTTSEDIDLTFEALQAGALTVVRKPGPVDPEGCDRLVQSVRLMAGVPVVHHWGRKERPAPQEKIAPTRIPDGSLQSIKIIGIASSTGGPGVLATLLSQLPDSFPVPVLVVQHVTNGFAAGLAEWLNTQTALTVKLARSGDKLQGGTVFIAPDDAHMQVTPGGVLQLTMELAYKGLRPSANYLFHSLANVYGKRAMGVILTGMGDDGVNGLEALHRAGGLTLAQDEESCVVYGMPREAVFRGAADRSLTPDQIVRTMIEVAKFPGEG